MSLLGVLCFSWIVLLRNRNEPNPSGKGLIGPYCYLSLAKCLLRVSLPGHLGLLHLWLHRLPFQNLLLKLVDAVYDEIFCLAGEIVGVKFGDRYIAVVFEVQKLRHSVPLDAFG